MITDKKTIKPAANHKPILVCESQRRIAPVQPQSSTTNQLKIQNRVMTRPLLIVGILALIPVLVVHRATSASIRVLRDTTDGGLDETCNSHIYCQGNVLHTIQLSHAYPDSKTFVDMCMIADESETIANFNAFMAAKDNKPSREDVRDFLAKNFRDGNEIEFHEPSDWQQSPKIIDKLPDARLKQWVGALNDLWKNLTRRVKDDVRTSPTRYSIEPVPNAFVIPGGRFKEIYYWDSYWIIKGLLVCEMTETARGMIENMLWLVDKYGFVPNGGRVYYAKRSQPPLLTRMARIYMDATNDITWLRKILPKLESEIGYWFRKHSITVNNHTLFRYYAPSAGPRPESYREDLKTADGNQDLYTELKSGAESGWDYSSRWFIDEAGGNSGNLSGIATTSIVPVDLNAFLCGAFQYLAEFHELLDNAEGAKKWRNETEKIKQAIHAVLWNADEETWFDYNLRDNKQRPYFYPSNAFPLWSKCVPNVEDLPKYGDSVAAYFNRTGALSYPGGVPNSLNLTGEQWDFPAAWPPLQGILVESLRVSGGVHAKEVARELAVKWVSSNYKAFVETGAMFEKYNAETVGKSGGGGEYSVQTGFGWSNGVVLEMLNDYSSISIE